MVDLVLRPSGLEEKHGKLWALQLRYPGMPSTEYMTLACVSDEVAQHLVEAGAPSGSLANPTGPSATD